MKYTEMTFKQLLDEREALQEMRDFGVFFEDEKLFIKEISKIDSAVLRKMKGEHYEIDKIKH